MYETCKNVQNTLCGQNAYSLKVRAGDKLACRVIKHFEALLTEYAAGSRVTQER
jgi:hypothetical protein